MSDNKDFPWIKSYTDNLDWDLPIPDQPVYSMMDHTIVAHGNRPAFDFLGKKTTWNEMGHAVNRLAGALQAMGLKKGQKVGIFLPNTPYFVISYYAILKAGGTVVNYNPLYAERELAFQIEDSETEIMITADLELLYEKMDKMLADTRLNKIILARFTDMLAFPKNMLFKLVKGKELAKPDEKDIEAGRVVWWHDLIAQDNALKPKKINPEKDVAVIQYTGGTTGVPKGAMLTHRNIVANTEQAVHWLGGDMPEGEGRMLGVLPFFHVFAMTGVMNFSVRMGFEIVALPRFELDQTLKLIDKKKPHYFPAVPAIYNAINNHKKVSSFDLTSLRYCISGGAPLPVEVKKSFEQKTGCVVVEGYGLSESSPVVCVNPPQGQNRAGSIGLPFPQTIVEIVDKEDKSKVLPYGERGELRVKGPQVMQGYYKKKEETENVLKDGFLYTGDIAIMDEDGYVTIVDRIKDLIITNGYNVYPRNVEEAIYLHPSVEECIVAGLPDEQRGEIVKAWVKCKDGRDLSADDLKEFLNDKISKMEIPRHIEIREEPLPKTMIGKLSRKDILAEELGK